MTVQDQVFLYCFLIYEQSNEDVFSFLPAERAEIIKKELPKFTRFPKEVRLSLVSKLLGYLVRHVRNPQLMMIHASWIAEALKDAQPEIAAAILQKFPPDFRSEIYDCLPPRFEEARPAALSQEARLVIQQIFRKRFAAMTAPWGDKVFSLNTLHLLKEQDVLTVIRHIGLREMARAFVIAGKNALSALLTRVPDEWKDDMLNAVKVVKEEPEERHKNAAKQMSKYDLASLPFNEAILLLGLGKMKRLLPPDKDLVLRIAQRIHFRYGSQLLPNGKEEPRTDDENPNEIMDMTHLLIQSGKVDKSYVEAGFVTLDPEQTKTPTPLAAHEEI